mgnify:FL=1
MKVKRSFRICILGSGFGGITTLIHLNRFFKNESNIEIILISNKGSFLFTPLLHEAATGEVAPENIIYPLSKLQHELKKFIFIKETITEIDFDAKEIITYNQRITYDYLVISLGSATNFYGNETIKQHALALKNLKDAVKIREHLTTVIELAENEPAPEKRKKSGE